jgi:opacity protein-like surface antigen
MNAIKTVLLSGLLAAVGVTCAGAACNDGGFSVGAKAGVSFTKTKMKDNDGQTSKKKALIPMVLFGGYAARINDVMLGMDLGFGTQFGKVKKDSCKLQNTWLIDVLPRIGYLVTPQTEIYVTGGVRFGKYKMTVGSKTKKKMKVSGLLGAGGRYTFTGGFFLGAEYLYQFRTKMPVPKGISGTAKLSGHTIQLVAGMQF